MIRYGLILAVAAGLADAGETERKAVDNPPLIQAALTTTPSQGISVAPSLDDAVGDPTNPGGGKFDVLPIMPTQPATRQPPTGNPLWAVPLSTLSATRERPIFSPSRRPPPPVVVGTPYVAPAAPPPPKASGPVHPQLALVGTVASETEGIGVFIDQATNGVVRLRMGEGYSGWILREVRPREVVLENDQQTEVLRLPAPDTAKTALPGQAPPAAREPDL
jgi:general secretion pathway protein N